MDVLIIKMNAAGDVVRTTPLLRRLNAHVTWITAARNLSLIEGVFPNLRCFSWERRKDVLDANYDLVINLEDEAEIATFVNSIRFQRFFGACLNRANEVTYSEDSHEWFDLGLISRFGRQQADERKLRNRKSYQDPRISLGERQRRRGLLIDEQQRHWSRMRG